MENKESHIITLHEAARSTKRYRDSPRTGKVLGHYFKKSELKKMLDQENCVGLRAYYALDENNLDQLVVTGVDSSGNDLFTGLLLKGHSNSGNVVPTLKSPLNTYIRT